MTDGHTDEIKQEEVEDIGDLYLITWKKFENRNVIDMTEVVKIDDPLIGVKKIKQMNAEARLTTTDYRYYNLTEILEKKNIQIS